jgi:hypothetical protein
LTINRQIDFDRQIVNQTWNFSNENFTLIQVKRKTKNDFDRLLKQICLHDDNDDYSQYQLNDIMTNELDDQDLNKILSSNMTQYSHCEW